MKEHKENMRRMVHADLAPTKVQLRRLLDSHDELETENRKLREDNEVMGRALLCLAAATKEAAKIMGDV